MKLMNAEDVCFEIKLLDLSPEVAARQKALRDSIKDGAANRHLWFEECTSPLVKRVVNGMKNAQKQGLYDAFTEIPDYEANTELYKTLQLYLRDLRYEAEILIERKVWCLRTNSIRRPYE